ncbi:MAG: aminoacyl-histidine dipeptidase [Ruminiclostridium sp.]|nr:aminoacyl-histidine dipeptidase [Ruminiclostridium sp.]
MAVLEHLEPKKVFSYFEEIAAIPHGSGNIQAISDYLADFAAARGLECHRDAMNNIIIIKEATPGYEGAAPVILQGHMDMVCDLAPDCTKDMETEGLDLACTEEYVYAKGTTLGGDDGIAVAMTLAILDSNDLAHPRLEVVLTVDEEIGMLGALGLDASPLTAKRLISLDSETEDTIFVSCAGGNMSHLTMPLTREPYEGAPLVLAVGGLLGGHSGVDIHLGRGNAIQLLGRVLGAAAKVTDLRVVTVKGGARDNAIPSEAQAVVLVQVPEAVVALCGRMDAVLKAELATPDPDVTVTAQAGETGLALDRASTEKVLFLLACAPNGVQVMSSDIPDLVQTSLNLGTLVCEGDRLDVGFCLRSSVDTQTQMLVERLELLATQLGGALEVSGEYPGWPFRPDSPLRELMAQVYVEQFGKEPKIKAIHAGAECGVFSGKIPGLDCLCISPDMTGLHTYHEKLYIASTQRIWNLVIETLKRMK